MELVQDEQERSSLQAQRTEERERQEERQRAERRQAQIFQSAEGLSEAQVDNEFLDANNWKKLAATISLSSSFSV